MSGAFTFRMEQPIAFEHVDAAGWVFYPRYAAFVNRAVERAFGEGLDWSYARMHLEEHLAIPTVELNMKFLKPSRLGETLAITLEAVDVGRRSLTLDVEMRVAGEETPRVTARVVVVHVAMGDPPQTRPWPEAIAAKLRGEGP
ncbi:MAG: acyl-CoA thioesterase [Myxococcota bacterium]